MLLKPSTSDVLIANLAKTPRFIPTAVGRQFLLGREFPTKLADRAAPKSFHFERIVPLSSIFSRGAVPSRSEETFHAPRRKAGRNNDKTVRAVRWPQTANAVGHPRPLPLSRDDVRGEGEGGVVSRGNSLRQQQFRGTSMFTARRVNAKTTLPLLWTRPDPEREQDPSASISAGGGQDLEGVSVLLQL
ncbi:hypothetical protein K0M31_018885 [Melipona bicolor]|uniref:Uncharacterized protein n=1 Tax=Melipona bicolor TaxID=60889 RepID=A0AA40G484_9HYME|nr:hypothetical protein K0M31_018885 [Melipona bicolor]